MLKGTRESYLETKRRILLNLSVFWISVPKAIYEFPFSLMVQVRPCISGMLIARWTSEAVRHGSLRSA
jgi:hypothetical protein